MIYKKECVLSLVDNIIFYKGITIICIIISIEFPDANCHWHLWLPPPHIALYSVPVQTLCLSGTNINSVLMSL